MLDKTDLPGLAAVKARRQPDTPLRALHRAWLGGQGRE